MNSSDQDLIGYNMDISDLQEHEYDAHLFGFTVADFMRAIRILVKDEISRFTGIMTSALLKKYSPNDPEIHHVKELTKTLIDRYMCASVEPLKTLESQMKELLHIPPHVLLEPDAVQRTQYSVQDEQEINQQLQDLFKRIKRTKSFDVELQQELIMLKEALPLLSKRIAEFEGMVAGQKQNEKILQSVESVVDQSVNLRMQSLSLQDCVKFS